MEIWDNNVAGVTGGSVREGDNEGAQQHCS